MSLENKTCLHRFVGDCLNCKRDYTSELNNTCCPRYYEIGVRYFVVKNEKKENEKNKEG